jgi:ribonuclease HII
MKITPTMKYEKKLWNDGYKYIAGIDEAGRGAWAGPVVVAAVVLPQNHRKIKGVTDSKLISAKKRDELYEKITEQALDFGIGIIDHRTIDRIGILEATRLGAKEAVDMMAKDIDYLLVDCLDLRKHLSIEQESIIHGDQIIYSISCASILAKVTRDNLMSNLAGDYSKYEFYKHKGYGTKLHQAKLAEHGVSGIHRRSYKPIKAYL